MRRGAIILIAFVEEHCAMSTTGKIETKLKKMGLEIPPTHPYPSPNRTSAVQVGNLLFLSGHGTGRQAMPLNIKQYGKVGGDVSEKEAYVCAKSAALCMLASIKKAVGDLDRVKRVIRLYGMVNCAPDFDRHMVVIDGASDLFYALWGPVYGQHARAAVGIGGLPRGAVLEIMGEFELHAEKKPARKSAKPALKRAVKRPARR
jgi:enamine deaminase RidA (YjgF/YER057c/UK114 family)